MQGTDTHTTVPSGYPLESHLVSASKPIVIAFLCLYAAGVGISAWCLCELRSARAEIQMLRRMEVK